MLAEIEKHGINLALVDSQVFIRESFTRIVEHFGHGRFNLMVFSGYHETVARLPEFRSELGPKIALISYRLYPFTGDELSSFIEKENKILTPEERIWIGCFTDNPQIKFGHNRVSKTLSSQDLLNHLEEIAKTKWPKL